MWRCGHRTVDRHRALRPTGCDRAEVHLERGCLALAAWHAIIDADAACSKATESDITNCIAQGLGMDMLAATGEDRTDAADSSVPVRCRLYPYDSLIRFSRR